MVDTNSKKGPPRVSLLALAEDPGEVEIMGYDEEGNATSPRWVRVKHADGYSYDAIMSLLEQQQSGVMPRAGELYQLSLRLIPDASKEECMRLNPQQLGAIITLATGQVKDMEGFIQAVSAKNGDGAAKEKPQQESPLSMSAATSSTSSPGSVAPRSKRSSGKSLR